MKKTLLSSLLAFSLTSLIAEEGMWVFNALPIQQIKDKYGVELDQAWTQHVQKSCLRVSLGVRDRLSPQMDCFLPTTMWDQGRSIIFRQKTRI